MTLTQKKEKRAALVTNMRSTLDTARNAGREMTADEQSVYANQEAEYDRFSNEIKQEETLRERETSLGNLGGRPTPPAQPGNGNREHVPDEKEVYSNAFAAYLRRGQAGVEVHANRVEFMNALQVGTDSEGGYLVPTEMAGNIVTKLGENNVVRKYANIIQTASDRDIPIDTGRAAFAWTAEEAATTPTDAAFGSVTVSAHKLTGIIKVSEELLQDSAFNLVGHLEAQAAQEIDLREEAAFCTGDNSGKPNGLFAVTSVGGVSLTGETAASTTVLTTDELIDTYYALAKSYRRNAVWLTSDTVEKNVRKLKGSDGQYIWQPSLREGTPDVLLGRPFETSDSATTPATGVRSVVFGDLGYYTIVDRLNMIAQRLNELYAVNGQVGFRFAKRVDGELTLAQAVTYIAQA